MLCRHVGKVSHGVMLLAKQLLALMTDLRRHLLPHADCTVATRKQVGCLYCLINKC